MRTAIAVFMLTGLALAQAPINDECAAATVVGPGVHNGTTAGATPSSPAPTACSTFGAATADVWFSITSPTQRWIYVKRTGTGADKLAVFSGACGASMTQIACQFSSELAVFLASANVTYRIRVGQTQPTSMGPFQLEITSAAPPTNDNCLNAIPVFNGVNPGAPNGQSGMTFTNYPSTQSFSPSLCSPSWSGPLNDVWFTYVATSPTTTFRLGGATQPYGTLAPGFEVVVVFDSCGGAPIACQGQSSIATVIGQTYKISVSAIVGWTGTFYLVVMPYGAASLGGGCGAFPDGHSGVLSANIYQAVGGQWVISAAFSFAKPGSPYLWAGGFASAPIDLGFLGAGCATVLDPATFFFIPFDGLCTSYIPGYVCFSTYPAPIPPILSGGTYFIQAANFPTTGPVTFQLTNVVQVTFP